MEGSSPYYGSQGGGSRLRATEFSWHGIMSSNWDSKFKRISMCFVEKVMFVLLKHPSGLLMQLAEYCILSHLFILLKDPNCSFLFRSQLHTNMWLHTCMWQLLFFPCSLKAFSWGISSMNSAFVFILSKTFLIISTFFLCLLRKTHLKTRLRQASKLFWSLVLVSSLCWQILAWLNESVPPGLLCATAPAVPSSPVLWRDVSTGPDSRSDVLWSASSSIMLSSKQIAKTESTLPPLAALFVYWDVADIHFLLVKLNCFALEKLLCPHCRLEGGCRDSTNPPAGSLHQLHFNGICCTLRYSVMQSCAASVVEDDS